MNIEQRLQRLEKQSRRLRATSIVALLALGSLFMMGQATQDEPEVKHYSAIVGGWNDGVPEEIQAKRFSVVDDAGTVLATLSADKSGPFVRFYDSRGNTSTELHAGATDRAR